MRTLLAARVDAAPRRMRTLLAALLVAVTALLGFAGVAAANNAPYAESSYVKPNGTANTWYWEATPPGGVPTAYCFSYAKGPSFSTYQAVSTGNTPPAVPFTYCNRFDTGRSTFERTLSGLVNGESWRYCGQEWVYISGSWSASAYPVQCMDITVDSQAPSLTLTLAGGASYTSSASISRSLAYSDSVSPPWPDNRICTVNSRNCTGADTFNYDAACSSGAPRNLTTTYTCTYAYPGADGPVYQCAIAYDSASADVIPTLANAPSLNLNPAYPAGTGNRSSIGCDSVTVDRTGPSLTPGASQTTITAGATVDFSLAANDAYSGLAGTPQWNFGDGGTGSGSAPSHTFTTPGVRTVQVSQADALGNNSTAQLTISVNAPSTPTPAATPTPAPTSPPAATPTPKPGTTPTPTPAPNGGSAGGDPSTGGGSTPSTGPTTGGSSGNALSDTSISQAVGGGGVSSKTTAGLKVVAPKRVSLRKAKRALPLAVTVPSAGKLEAKLRKGSRVLATVGTKVEATGKLGLTLRLPKTLAVGTYELRVTLTPTSGGKPIVVKATIKVAR